MPIPNESASKDAPASLDTGYCFVPNEEGAFTSASKNNTFMGSLSSKFDEDWVIIELQAGKEYTFTLKGAAVDGIINPETGDSVILEDPILMILDSKGGHIETSDDVDPGEGDLSSEIVIAPDEDGIFYLSVSAYTGNPAQSNSGGYVIEVTERAVGPADITGTGMADKLEGTSAGETIVAMEGNDVVNAGDGDDTVDAGDGNDLVMGGPGADMLDGGDGTDTASYMDSPEGEMITINLRGNLASGGDADGDSLENFENVIGALNAANMLTGDRGDNRLDGGAHDDVLVGDRGDDRLNGGAGNDELDGGDGDDTLNGGYGADDLTGGDGDDWASYAGSMMPVTVRLHSRQAMGGDAEGDTWGDLVTVEYDNPDPEAPADERVLEETVPDIINLIGSSNADVLAGDSRDNMINGGRGDDKLYGGPGGGKDTLDGGPGDDMLFGGIGDDTLRGGDGDDLLSGGAGNDRSYGGPGSDMIYATVASDTGIVNDSVIDGWTGAATDNTNTPVDETDEDAMGNDPHAVDTVSFEKVKRGVHTGEDGIYTSADTDPFSLVDDASNVENIIGSSFNDAFVGDGGDNVIEGGDGADFLNGAGQGTDPTDIGDTVSYRNSDGDVAITLNDAADTAGIAIGAHAQGDVIQNFENIIGSAYGDDLTGNTGNNWIWGLAGEDEIAGGDGSDTIEGGADADELNGGTTGDAPATNVLGNDTSNDTLSYASSDAPVSVNLATNNVSGGHADGDELGVLRGRYDHDGDSETDPINVSTFESVTGSMHDDRLTGDHRDNTLNGGAGDDILRGGASSTADDGNADIPDSRGDVLIGGPGADVLDGGEDKDEEDNMVPDPADTDPSDGIDMVAASVDVASYATAMAGVTVDLHARKGTGGDAMGDTYSNIEQYMGSSNDDTFIAGEGVDNINAGGHDMDDVGKRTDGDTISYEESEEGVTLSVALDTGTVTVDAANADDGDNDINFATGDVLVGFENITGSQKVDNLTTTGAQAGDKATVGSTLMGLGGNDSLTGGGANDTLMGGKGRDTIVAGAGEDRIVGGAGDDVMTGGDGNDVFVFSPREGSGVDTIKDFAFDLAGDSFDQIDLSAFGITSVDELVGNISIHNDDVRIDLTDFGGGIIILEGAVTLDNLDTAENDPDTTVDETTDGIIQSLSTGDDGLFII